MCNFFIGQPRILTLIFNKYTSHCCFTQKHILNLSIYAISCTYLCQKNAFDRSCTHRYSFFFLCHYITIQYETESQHVSHCYYFLLLLEQLQLQTQEDNHSERKREGEKIVIKISTAIFCHIFYYIVTYLCDMSFYTFHCIERVATATPLNTFDNNKQQQK